MQLTKGAIGNLINRYRAVLKKCHLLNVFGSLAVAGMLVMGGAAAAGAATWTQSDGSTGEWNNGVVDNDTVLNGSYEGFSQTEGTLAGVATIDYNTTGVSVAGGTTFDNNSKSAGAAGALKIMNGINIGNNVTFKNNKAEAPAWGGGALYIKLVKPSDAVNSATPSANQTVTIDTNAVFTGNEANSLGGAIALEYGQLTIAEGARFENNKADTGGAIAMWHDGDTNGETSGSQLNISKADFSGNEASLYGGALFLADTAGGEVTITDSTFTGNKSELLGGAIFNAGTLTITGDNTFTGNTAAGEANDIYNLGTITVADGTTSLGGGLTLANGTVKVTETGSFDGKVTWVSGTKTAAKSLVVANTNDVTLNGGMLMAENGSASATINVSSKDSLTFDGALFENQVVTPLVENGGGADGAIISLAGNGTSTLTIMNSKFNHNRFSDQSISQVGNGVYGGAIGVQNATVTLDTVTLSQNTAESKRSAQGGAYYQSGGTLNADTLTVTDNTATSSGTWAMGGGMALFSTKGNLVNATFSGNSAIANDSAADSALGGAIYMAGGTWGGAPATFSISQTSFTQNRAESSKEALGGAISIAGAPDDMTVSLSDVDFDTNTAKGSTSKGGAIYNTGTLTITNNSTFTGNKAEGTNGWGGAIYNAGTLTVDGTRFENNTASAQGGAIYVHPKAELDVTNSYFKGNGGTAGGAIAMFGDNGAAPEHSISNTVFEGNTADRTGDKLGKGGAIAILQMDTPREQYTTKLDLNGVTFIGNTSNGTGGAIHSEYGTLTITDATFSGNSAEQQGGAIYNDANSSITFKGDNLFTGNTAAEGKDIYNEGTLDFAGTNTQMDGGMVMADGTMTVANSQVNMAELDARAGNITVTGSELSVSKLTGNTLGSSLTVDTDGIVNIGNLDTTKLGEAMNDAGMGDGSAVLALNTSVSLTGDARLVVGTDASDKATAVFGDNSLLVVDAEGVADKQVIHADGNGKTAFIHSNAQLRIINAVADEYVTVLNGFDTIRDEQHALNAGWVKTDGVENLDYMLSSYAMITDEKDVVVVSKLNDPTAALPGIDPDLAPVLNEVWANKLNDVDSPDMGVRFLSRAARADYINGDAAKSAATIESAARIAFAGAVPQMTKMASDAATNAVVNRLGFANPADGAQAMNAEGKIVDRNTTGFALWIAPLWQNQHGWGMEAGNLDYGFNGNLGGVSLGADYTFENAIRAGITFNIGGGYAESSGGDLNSTENRMTFWGLGAYAGWNYENFGLMADVSYTSTWNDLEQDLDPGMGMGDLEADVQATAISAGLRAEYKLETSVLDIIPHIGVRYMSLNTWGYDVDANGGTVLEGDGFHQDIWTFPIGVTFSKDFTLDSGWFFKPSVDFSVIPAAGDIKAKHDVQFTGAPAVAEMETQMMDYLTWQGGVGIQMGNDNLSFGVNYTLQAGQNTTGHGVFGSFRYEF